ncbi:MAG: AraC family transcriptional regulator [Bacteroidales bacterium]|nr:AraC family transcriptional regulator [Bacteroidales bacterium]
MKTKIQKQHPMLLNLHKIKENGIVILDDVRGLPSGDESYTSPEYVICIGHQGNMQLCYDDYPDHSEARTVAVVFPNHTLRKVSLSDNYLATLIVVDSTMLNDPLLNIINQMRYRYEPHPWVKLDRHQYGIIMKLVGVMRETSTINIDDCRLLLTRQLEYLMRLLGYYRDINLQEPHSCHRVSTKFLNDLANHFRKHRDVAFYAEKACLSTKHFSTVIKQETGHTAAWWIHTQVVNEAKMLLHMRNDLNIQAIADLLGFNDQSTFSRYFQREIGLYPTEYRKQLKG